MSHIGDHTVIVDVANVIERKEAMMSHAEDNVSPDDNDGGNLGVREQRTETAKRNEGGKAQREEALHIPWRDPKKVMRPYRFTKHELGVIRVFLNMPKGMHFYRCHSKNHHKLKEFERKGDMSHSAPTHLCNICCCNHVAGTGTHGDLYGLGFDTGHYGTGFCWKHEIRRNRNKAEAYWRKQMAEIQTCNLSVIHVPETKREIEREALEAEANLEIKQAIEQVQNCLAIFKGTKTLTEYVKGELEQASGVTIAKLQIEAANALGRLAETKFKLDSSMYVNVDEIKIRMPAMISLAYRFIQNEDDRKLFLMEMRRLWTNMKTGVR